MTTLAATGPSLPRVIAAEWTKLLGLRSSLITVAVTAAVSGIVTYLSANASSGDPGFDPLDDLSSGLPVAVIGPLVLGVLVGTGEFSTGMFRSTFAAVPRRLPVLLAQFVVTTVLAVVAAVLAVGAAVVGILPAAASRNITPDLLSDGTPQSLLGAGAFLVGAALFGLAAGALLRRTIPALLATIVVSLVLPIVLSLAAEFANDPMAAYDPNNPPTGTAVVNTIITFTPTGAGSLLIDPSASGVDGAPHIGAVGAALTLAAWVVVPLGVAALRLRRRDLV